MQTFFGWATPVNKKQSDEFGGRQEGLLKLKSFLWGGDCSCPVIIIEEVVIIVSSGDPRGVS